MVREVVKGRSELYKWVRMPSASKVLLEFSLYLEHLGSYSMERHEKGDKKEGKQG